MRLRFLVMLMALGVVGCSGGTVEVECRSSGDTAVCWLRHVDGKRAVNACFDVELGCRSGSKAKASACESVSPGQVTTRVFKRADFAGIEGCEITSPTIIHKVIHASGATFKRR